MLHRNTDSTCESLEGITRLLSKPYVPNEMVLWVKFPEFGLLLIGKSEDDTFPSDPARWCF